MKRDSNSFTSMLQIVFLSSLCWVLGILISLLILGLGSPIDMELAFLLLVGLLGGMFVATAQWLLLHDQINSYRAWLALSCAGALGGVFIASSIAGIHDSIWIWFLSGILGGGFMGGLQIIGLTGRSSERLLHLGQVSLSWGTAFLLAHTLANGSMSVLPDSASLILSGIIGWGVLVLITLWSVIGIAPIPKRGYPSGRIRWWY